VPLIQWNILILKIHDYTATHIQELHGCTILMCKLWVSSQLPFSRLVPVIFSLVKEQSTELHDWLWAVDVGFVTGSAGCECPSPASGTFDGCSMGSLQRPAVLVVVVVVVVAVVVPVTAGLPAAAFAAAASAVSVPQ